jgi:tRNA(Ile)-lysidine synthase
MEFIAKFTQAIQALGLQNHRVLVAVSGGADSIALLRGFHTIANQFSLDLYAAHVNHGIRQDKSEADSQWVQSVCRSDLSIPCVVADLHMSADQSGLEETARDQRYEFLTETAASLECSFVAFGHNANDQTETVLHRLIRGTGLAGLQGIPRTRPLAGGIDLVRPMLDISRAEIKLWLEFLDQSWREDHSNLDNAMTRNRLRNELIPQLEEQYNPQIGKVLGSLSAQARECHDLVTKLIEPLITDALVGASDQVIRLKAAAFENQPAILIRESLVRIWGQAGWPLKRMGFSEWDSLANLIMKNQNARSLPGNIDARNRGGLIVFTKPPKLDDESRQART